MGLWVKVVPGRQVEQREYWPPICLPSLLAHPQGTHPVRETFLPSPAHGNRTAKRQLWRWLGKQLLGQPPAVDGKRPGTGCSESGSKVE